MYKWNFEKPNAELWKTHLSVNPAICELHIQLSSIHICSVPGPVCRMKLSNAFTLRRVFSVQQAKLVHSLLTSLCSVCSLNFLVVLLLFHHESNIFKLFSAALATGSPAMISEWRPGCGSGGRAATVSLAEVVAARGGTRLSEEEGWALLCASVQVCRLEAAGVIRG